MCSATHSLQQALQNGAVIEEHFANDEILIIRHRGEAVFHRHTRSTRQRKRRWRANHVRDANLARRQTVHNTDHTGRWHLRIAPIERILRARCVGAGDLPHDLLNARLLLDGSHNHRLVRGGTKLTHDTPKQREYIAVHFRNANLSGRERNRCGLVVRHHIIHHVASFLQLLLDVDQADDLDATEQQHQHKWEDKCKLDQRYAVLVP